MKNSIKRALLGLMGLCIFTTAQATSLSVKWGELPDESKICPIAVYYKDTQVLYLPYLKVNDNTYSWVLQIDGIEYINTDIGKVVATLTEADDVDVRNLQESCQVTKVTDDSADFQVYYVKAGDTIHYLRFILIKNEDASDTVRRYKLVYFSKVSDQFIPKTNQDTFN